MATFNYLVDADRIHRCPRHMMQKQALPCDDHVWDRIKHNYAPYNVFVNIPYEVKYRPLQATIIAALFTCGLNPRLAGLRSQGQPIRVCKICELMQCSKYCLTDLSRVKLHNMPFELGLCIGLGRQATSLILIDQKFITVDAIATVDSDRDGTRQQVPNNNQAVTTQVKKFAAQLSNLTSVEVIVHENNPEKLAKGLLKRLRDDIPEAIVPKTEREVTSVVKQIKRLTKTFSKGLEDNTLDDVIEAHRELAATFRNGGGAPPPENTNNVF